MWVVPVYNCSMHYRLLIKPLLLLGIVLLAACADTTVEQPFRLYLERLGTTLEVEATTTAPAVVIPRLPRPGQLRLEITSDTLGTLDFMDLRGCALQTTIGKSNSSLGRLARDSQKLLLALEFLQLAPECVTTLEDKGDDALAQTLARAHAIKQRQLPALIFNATLGSEEFQGFWRPGPLQANYPQETSSEVITAMEGITASSERWLTGDYNADNMTLELQLSAVAGGDGGQLWKALQHQEQWLTRANSMLRQKLQSGPLCAENYRPAAAKILPNVIDKFFIQGIQPRAAAMGRRYHQLLPPVEKLEQLLQPDLPDNYRDWQQQRIQAMTVLTRQPRDHVTELQKLLSSCQGNP